MRDERGRFLPGPDGARHDFTDEERAAGGRATWRLAMYDRPELLRWLQRRIDRTARPGTIAAYRRRTG
jgi:hypothetical protein